MKGDVWGIQQVQNGTLDVIIARRSAWAVKKTGKYWRILALDFNV